MKFVILNGAESKTLKKILGLLPFEKQDEFNGSLLSEVESRRDWFYHRSLKWDLFLKRLREKISKRKMRLWDQITREKLEASYLHRIDLRYKSAFMYADLRTLNLKHKVSYILVAPKEIVLLFQKQGLPINSFFSQLAYLCDRFFLLIQINAQVLKSFLKDCFLVRANPPVLPQNVEALFLGLSSNEMHVTPDKLSIYEFIKTSRLQAIQNMMGFSYIHWEESSSFTVDEKQKTIVGRDPFDLLRKTGGRDRLLFSVKYLWNFIKLLTSFHFHISTNFIFLSELPGFLRGASWPKKESLKQIFLTQSSYNNIPFWVLALNGKDVVSCTLSYSAHFLPTVYTSDPLGAWPEPVEQYLLTDKITAWSMDHKNHLLNKLGISSDRVVVTGALILGHTPKNLKKQVHRSKTPVLTVFDLAAKKQQFKLSYLGMGLDHNNGKTMVHFLKDILECSREIWGADFMIYFKSKRPSGKAHDEDYVAFMETFRNEKNVKVFDSSTNPIYVMSSAWGVVSAPYTSVSLIAEEMGLASIYYDPTEQLQALPELESQVDLVQGKQALKGWLKSLER